MLKTKNSSPTNWVRQAAGKDNRIEACFSGQAYAPHRHDTYTLAITTQGVQSFNYRGQLRHSLPGQLVVLHPDEMHDGLAGNEQPFSYRAIDIEPSLIQEILGGYRLPFLTETVTSDKRLAQVALRLLGDFENPLSEFETQEAIYDFANVLQQMTDNKIRHTQANYQAVLRAREYIDESLNHNFNLDQLATIANYSKWQLCRDFRSLYGTSPFRYLTLKRIQQAQKKLLQGQALSKIALDCHFADQSHLSRQFKKSLGTSPKKWLMLIKNSQAFH